MFSRRRGLTTLPLVILLLSFALGFAPTNAGAQQVPGLDDNPAPQDQPVESWALAPAGTADPGGPTDRSNLTYDVAAGTTIDDSVDVANWGTVPLLLHIYAADGLNNDSGGFDLVRGDQTSTDVGSWVQIEQDFVTIAPKTAYRIPIKIVVPVDATAGDHPGGVVAALTTPGTGADGKTVTLEQRTGTRLYVRVQGKLNPDLAVENVHTSYTPKLSPLGGTATVRYTIVNRGNTRMKGTRKVEVGGPFGLLSKTTEAEDTPELLPGQSVDFTTTINGVAAPVLLFTNVKLSPEEVVQDDAGVSGASGGAFTLALPLLLVALVLIIMLLLVARRQYMKRKQPPAGPAGGGTAGRGPNLPSDPSAREIPVQRVPVSSS